MRRRVGSPSARNESERASISTHVHMSITEWGQAPGALGCLDAGGPWARDHARVRAGQVATVRWLPTFQYTGRRGRMARWSGGALLAAAVLAGSAAAHDMGVHATPETAAVAGKTLRLNGTAMMSMLWFQLYSVSLYLEAPVGGPAEAISSEQAKELRLTLHHRASSS